MYARQSQCEGEEGAGPERSCFGARAEGQQRVPCHAITPPLVRLHPPTPTPRSAAPTFLPSCGSHFGASLKKAWSCVRLNPPTSTFQGRVHLAKHTGTKTKSACKPEGPPGMRDAGWGAKVGGVGAAGMACGGKQGHPCSRLESTPTTMQRCIHVQPWAEASQR